ncbi:MAG: hypothetical protein KME57_35705 [Scytonema hyalinum WJT4-NPBG1]|jgi:hypothetical protein|nr:hypothetical protein [Scytonema hyalinum WJT4-NPBG1]
MRAVTILTSCTNRKRSGKEVLRLTGLEKYRSVVSLSKAWTEIVEKATPAGKASSIYQGRSFSEAKATASSIEASLYVVSAGLGIVSAGEMIPSYNLTVSQGPQSLAPLLTKWELEGADWWEALITHLGKQRSLSSLLERSIENRFLFALPASYIDLLSKELATLDERFLSHLYIITSERGKSFVPSKLLNNVMPYDERLEALSKYAGTRSDFPQRALRHFVQELQGHLKTPLEAREVVSNALAVLEKPTIPSRIKKSNEEIISHLRENWDRFDGTAHGLLRYLRDEAMIACEQSRFRNLWKQVKEELAAGA